MQVKVCRLESVSARSIKQFYVNEREVLVINIDGNFYCLDARCTHAGAPLAEGILDGEVLTCPWHGSQFRISNGVVQRGPAQNDLRVYPHKVRDNYLFIEF